MGKAGGSLAGVPISGNSNTLEKIENRPISAEMYFKIWQPGQTTQGAIAGFEPPGRSAERLPEGCPPAESDAR